MKTKKAGLMLAVMITILLAATLPSAAVAQDGNHCGPEAGRDACQPCPFGAVSECGGHTCYTELLPACRYYQVRPTSSSYEVQRSEPGTQVSTFTATSGAPSRAGTSLGCPVSEVTWTARGADYANDQRESARTRRSVCSASYVCLVGNFCLITTYSFPSETVP